MKKLLFGILTFLGICFSFCNADGIYWNSTLGLISYNISGVQLTLQDKNLGATSVYNGTANASTLGNFFQWGNNYGFPYQSASTTIQGPINVSGYGPGNYYSSSDFVLTSNGNWANSSFEGLWGEEQNTSISRQGPCPSGYHVPSYAEITSLKNSFNSNFTYSNVANYLKQPLQGGVLYYDNGHLAAETSYGNWWSSTPNIIYGDYSAFVLNFSYNQNLSVSQSHIGEGNFVRCFSNTYVEPDWSRTVLVGDSLLSYYNSDNIYNQSNTYTVIGGSSSYTNGPDYNCFRIATTNCRIAEKVSIQNPGDSVPLFLNAIPNAYTLICGLSSGSVIRNHYISNCQFLFYDIDLGGSSCPASTINLLYNNGNSTSTINCDGTNNITINGLSTITSTNTLTPYFNINYRDEDNQLLTESYSKDILYLSGSLFKKTYTGNNDRILTSQSNNNQSFTGYVPVFDVSGSTQPIDTDYNMFNNFADNSLKVLLSNIPGFFQYLIIFSIILLLIGIIKFFKKKR